MKALSNHNFARLRLQQWCRILIRCVYLTVWLHQIKA